MNPQYFSAIKTRTKGAQEASQRKSEPAKRGRKPQAIVEGYVAPPEKPKAVTGETDLLAAMEAMKSLGNAPGTIEAVVGEL